MAFKRVIIRHVGSISWLSGTIERYIDMKKEQDKLIHRRIGRSASLGLAGMAAGFVASFPLGYKFPFSFLVMIAGLAIGAAIGAFAKK